MWCKELKMKKSIESLLLVLSFGLFVFCLSCISLAPPLVNAAQDGKLEKVKKLVDGGADINEKSRYGHTALERAADNGHLEIVDYLLSKNAKDPQKAFQSALRNNYADVAKLFVDGGFVNINFNAQYFRSLLNKKEVTFEQRMQNVKYIAGDKLNSPYLLELVEPVYYQQMIDFFNINLEDKTDALGNSILHIAAMRNNLNLVKYLLEKKFNVNVLDNNNHTALFYCITSFGPSINWNNPIIEDETTAKINYISDMPYYSNSNDIKMRQAQIGTLLLDSRINVNQQNNSGWTVLHFACASYPTGPQETLIERGVNQNLKTNFGRTAADILALKK
jgi:ankyrin repeat protein